MVPCYIRREAGASFLFPPSFLHPSSSRRFSLHVPEGKLHNGQEGGETPGQYAGPPSGWIIAALRIPPLLGLLLGCSWALVRDLVYEVEEGKGKGKERKEEEGFRIVNGKRRAAYNRGKPLREPWIVERSRWSHDGVRTHDALGSTSLVSVKRCAKDWRLEEGVAEKARTVTSFLLLTGRAYGRCVLASLLECGGLHSTADEIGDRPGRSVTRAYHSASRSSQKALSTVLVQVHFCLLFVFILFCSICLVMANCSCLFFRPPWHKVAQPHGDLVTFSSSNFIQLV